MTVESETLSTVKKGGNSSVRKNGTKMELTVTDFSIALLDSLGSFIGITLIPSIFLIIFRIIQYAREHSDSQYIIEKAPVEKSEPEKIPIKAIPPLFDTKLLGMDPKIRYIDWAIKYFERNNKQESIRKLKNYYIPELLGAYEQLKEVDACKVTEASKKAKENFNQIMQIVYDVTQAEIKKVADGITDTMDCNVTVCKGMYQRDGYRSDFEKVVH